MRFLDSVTTGQPRITSDGYLVADVKAARTGISYIQVQSWGDLILILCACIGPESEVFHKGQLSKLRA